jgi:hypothetical protein
MAVAQIKMVLCGVEESIKVRRKLKEQIAELEAVVVETLFIRKGVHWSACSCSAKPGRTLTIGVELREVIVFNPAGDAE